MYAGATQLGVGCSGIGLGASRFRYAEVVVAA
jgi:hypothetical protein